MGKYVALCINKTVTGYAYIFQVGKINFFNDEGSVVYLNGDTGCPRDFNSFCAFWSPEFKFKKVKINERR